MNGCARARQVFLRPHWACDGSVEADDSQDFVKLFLVLVSIDGFTNIILGCTEKGANETLCQCVPGLFGA